MSGACPIKHFEAVKELTYMHKGFFVTPQHRFVRPLNKGTQLLSTLSYNQEHLPYPSQVLLLLRPWWICTKG